MKFGFALAAVAAGTFGFAGVAEAASFGTTSQDATFDFRGYGGLSDSYTFEDAGTGLSVTATAGPEGSQVFQSAWGLGVKNFENGGDSQGTQLDSFGTNESLFLSFSHDISVINIVLGEVDKGDDTIITLDSTVIFGNANVDRLLTSNDGLDTTATGSVLEFFVGDRRICGYSGCYIVEDRDDFTVKGITVTKAIPEPLTVIGTAVALGLGGTLRRKFAG